MIPLLLAILVQAQQPGQHPTTPPNPHAVPPQRVATGSTTSQPRTPYDSTVAAIRRIGVAVAEVKSGLESFNRAAAREPSGVVVERALLLQTACQGLARSAVADGRVLCRGCVRGQQATALEQYRAYLNSLARVGTQCSTSVARHRDTGTVDGMAAGLKREVHTMSQRIVEGLVPYEQRLAAVRTAFGWTNTTSGTPRRGP